jgi:Protein of unknown function (DUF3306)
MNDQEKFLTRWSRRKRKAADEVAPPEAPAAETPVVPGEQAAARPPVAAAPPEFDLSKLPSLDSIGAASDLTPFLQAGVPSALRHAALRRAWLTDPAIRDFKGLAENDWDFTSAGGAPGFGELDPQFDVKKLLAEIFGDAKPPVEPPDSAQLAPVPEESSTAAGVPASGEPAKTEPQQVASAATDPLLQRDENIAVHHDDMQSESSEKKIRRHGGAMPE